MHGTLPLINSSRDVTKTNGRFSVVAGCKCCHFPRVVKAMVIFIVL